MLYQRGQGLSEDQGSSIMDRINSANQFSQMVVIKNYGHIR